MRYKKPPEKPSLSIFVCLYIAESHRKFTVSYYEMWLHMRFYYVVIMRCCYYEVTMRCGYYEVTMRCGYYEVLL